MKEKIQVQMTEQALFDFMLYHTYSGFSGFLTNVLGLAVVFAGILMRLRGKISIIQLGLYILAGIVFLLFTPLQLRYRAKKQVRMNPEYKNFHIYIFDNDGICLQCSQQKTVEKKIAWSKIKKVVATPKTIGYYYEDNSALIIPKESYGDKFMPVMNIVFAHVPKEYIKIR